MLALLHSPPYCADQLVPGRASSWKDLRNITAFSIKVSFWCCKCTPLKYSLLEFVYCSLISWSPIHWKRYILRRLIPRGRPVLNQTQTLFWDMFKTRALERGGTYQVKPCIKPGAARGRPRNRVWSPSRDRATVIDVKQDEGGKDWQRNGGLISK